MNVCVCVCVCVSLYVIYAHGFQRIPMSAYAHAEVLCTTKHKQNLLEKIRHVILTLCVLTLF